MKLGISFVSSLTLYVYVVGSFLQSSPLAAQITTDGTTNTTVNADGNNFTVNQGDRVGDNLFHSFEEFSVPTLGSAAFNNASDIANIFSRVTGGNISNIDGLLSANGAANLYLINPNGIIFGENARLNLGGSFFASSADSLLFEDGLEFSASNPTAPPLIEVNIPVGLGFRDNPGDIINRSVAPNFTTLTSGGLQISSGETLALIGGNVSFDGGTITAPGGRVELGGLAEAGIVEVNDDGSLSFSDNLKRADIFLYGAEIDVVDSGGGSISIYADDLTISATKRIIGNAPQPGETYTLQVSLEDEKPNGSGVLGEQEPNNSPETAQNIDGFFSLSPNPDISNDTKFPHVSISATGNGTLDYYSFTVENRGSWGTFDIDYGDTGEAGSIDTELFLFDNQGNLIADNDDFGTLGGAGGSSSDLDPLISVFGFDTPGTYIIGVGKYDSRARSSLNAGIDSGLGSIDARVGDITIDATGTVTITAESEIFNEVRAGAIGNSGNINIQAESLLINDRAEVSSLTFGQGNAGNVSVNVQDSVSLINSGWLTSRVEDDAVGDGGNVEIKGQSLYMADFAEIFAQVAFAEGDGGDISIEVADQIELENAYILGRSANGAIGDAGNINLKARSLLMSDQGLISTSTFYQGNAGNINVEVSELVSLNNSNILSRVSWSDTVGDGGDINIFTPSLLLSEGSELSVSSYGQGNAGNININVSDAVIIDGENRYGDLSGILSELGSGARGKGGSIEITTDSLKITNGAQLSTSTFGQGNAGTIEIAADTLTATGNSTVQTNTTSSGRAGDITLNIRDSLNLTASAIEASTSAESTGNGGNIFIDPIQVTLTDGATISVNSQGLGNGGSIFLAADNLTLDNISEISAATASGEGGNITFSISDILRLLNNSPISATAGGTGNGGNIMINTDFLISTDNSDITANAFEGQGGNIDMTALGLFLSPDSQITASSQLGVDGIVEVNTPENDPSRGLVDLPENVVNPEDLISQNACKQGGQSKFTLTGRGGLPATPEQAHHSDEVEVGLVKPAMGVAAVIRELPVAEDSTKIVPAKGWIRNERGEVILVGYDPTVSNITPQTENLNLCQPQ